MNQLQRFAQWIASSPSLFELTPPFASLKDLDAKLPNDLSYQGNPRLGFLYQHLCTKLLTSGSEYSLELEEAQINRENGQTLGAIDLILRDSTSNLFEHWEVAIKFYLLHNGIWYGPNAHDQLDKKLSRMLSHQLKMSKTAEFSTQFPQYSDLTEHLLMQGRLYVNPFSSEIVPRECLGYSLDQSQISGYWCYQSQWEQITEPLYELEKPYWATGLVKFEKPIDRPTGKFVHAQTKNGQFWFVVADTWPNQ